MGVFDIGICESMLENIFFFFLIRISGHLERDNN